MFKKIGSIQIIGRYIIGAFLFKKSCSSVLLLFFYFKIMMLVCGLLLPKNKIKTDHHLFAM